MEDCLHELFLHLHENRQRLAPTDNIRFYLYRALRRRLAVTLGRLNKFNSESYRFDDAEFLFLPCEQQFVAEQLFEQQQRVLTHNLNQLPKRQKEILYLVYMKGLTYQQAAEVMEIAMKRIYNYF